MTLYLLVRHICIPISVISVICIWIKQAHSGFVSGNNTIHKVYILPSKPTKELPKGCHPLQLCSVFKKNKESNERWPFSCLVSPWERAARYFILYHHKYNESSRVCPCSRCPLPSLLTSYATMTATTPASSFIFSAVFDSTMPLKNVCPGHGFSYQWFLHHCIGFRQKNSQVTKNNDCKQTHSVITSKS